jgi:galactokinase
LQRGVEQDAPEIAVVIGLWRGGAAARFGGGGFGGRTHALSYHHRLVNVSTDYTD